MPSCESAEPIAPADRLRRGLNSTVGERSQQRRFRARCRRRGQPNQKALLVFTEKSESCWCKYWIDVKEVMRKAISEQMSFGDGFIDPSLYRLDEELKKVDELLSQGEVLKPFEALFDDSLGRPGTPAGIYLRMMYLKFRWGLSYEEVETEVKERLPWRYFCHLSLMDTVPDATTLIKLNQRFGEERIVNLNKQLVGHLVKHRAIKPRRIRIDSTTLEAHIAYPTDISILHQAVRTLTRTASSLGQKIVSHVRATKKAWLGKPRTNWRESVRSPSASFRSLILRPGPSSRANSTSRWSLVAPCSCSRTTRE